MPDILVLIARLHLPVSSAFVSTTHDLTYCHFIDAQVGSATSLAISFPYDCAQYANTPDQQQAFMQYILQSLEDLNVDTSQLNLQDMQCGSIVAKLLVYDPTLVTTINTLVNNQQLMVNINGNMLVASSVTLTPGLIISFQ